MHLRYSIDEGLKAMLKKKKATVNLSTPKERIIHNIR